MGMFDKDDDFRQPLFCWQPSVGEWDVEGLKELVDQIMGGTPMYNRDEILKRDFSSEFVKKMQNAMLTSHYKYGYVSQTYPVLAQAYKSLRQRLDLYEKTHNTEYLVDAANFAMIEFMFPSFEDASYIPTDSDKSPGLADGISYNELMKGE